ncbi:MAG: flagellar hook-basal body complex protein FliE [Deltaproteobacteria bacterium]|nr:flagellar hook-basal body complex protein FliE [Deltaproteobacteria bacterium]
MTTGAIESGARALAGDPAPAAGGPRAAAGGSFAERLGALLEDADRVQQDAEARARALAAGQGDVVETMVSLSRAELSVQLVTQVRDRALEAYHEIMRMQV